MIELQCFDLKGNTIQRFCQWDVNQEIHLYLDGYDLSNTPQIHFCNKDRDESIIVKSSVSGNEITASVPNQLLKESSTIYAYVYLRDNINTSMQRSVAYTKIPIVPRPEPGDYIHVNNNCIGYILPDVTAPYIPYPFEKEVKVWGYGLNGGTAYNFKGDSYISNGVTYSLNARTMANGMVDGVPKLTSGTVLITVGL